MPGDPPFLPHFWIVHALKLTSVTFLHDFSKFAVQHQKPWGFSWILSSVLRSFLCSFGILEFASLFVLQLLFHVALSTSSTLGHRSPSGVSPSGQEDALLLPGASGIPKDCTSLFAEDASIQKTSGQGASFGHPSGVHLDVEPYLSRPQVDTHIPGFLGECLLCFRPAKAS